MAEGGSKKNPPRPPPPPMTDPIQESQMENLTDDGKVLWKVRKPKVGKALYPRTGQRVDIIYSSYKEDYTCIEHKMATSFILGSDHCIQAFDLSVRKMIEGEVAIVKASAEYAFGIFGYRPKPENPKKRDNDSEEPEEILPYYGPNETIIFEISLLSHYDFDYRQHLPHKTRARYAEKLLERGNQLFVLKEYNKAIELYSTGIIYLTDYEVRRISQQELKLCAELEELLYLPLMSCYDKIGDIKRCHKAAERVLDTNCMNWKALFMKGRCMTIQGEKKGGLEFMEKALKLSPNAKEIKAAIDDVKVEIQSQSMTGKSKKKSKKRGKKGKQNSSPGFAQNAGHDGKKTESVVVIKESFEEATVEEIMDQTVLAAEEKRQVEIATINQALENHTEESYDKVIFSNKEKEEADLVIIKEEVDSFMEETIDQVIHTIEEKEKEAENLIITQGVGNIIEGIIDQVVTAVERKEKEAKIVVINESINNIIDEMIKQAVTNAEEKKIEDEKVIIGKSVDSFLEEIVDNAISIAEKKREDAEIIFCTQSNITSMERIIDDVVIIDKEEKNQLGMDTISLSLDNLGEQNCTQNFAIPAEHQEERNEGAILKNPEEETMCHAVQTADENDVDTEAVFANQTNETCDEEGEIKQATCWSCFKCKGFRKRISRFFRRFRRH